MSRKRRKQRYIDIERESLLSLAHAAAKLPCRRGEKKTHVATLHRWATDGLRGVVLETLQCGGSLCTSMPALQRFFERLSAQRTSQPSLSTPIRADVEAALDAEGFGRPPPVKNPDGLNEQIGGSAMPQTENR
jgi:Protein of unknown function (DUF1580)